MNLNWIRSLTLIWTLKLSDDLTKYASCLFHCANWPSKCIDFQVASHTLRLFGEPRDMKLLTQEDTMLVIKYSIYLFYIYAFLKKYRVLKDVVQAIKFWTGLTFKLCYRFEAISLCELSISK